MNTVKNTNKLKITYTKTKKRFFRNNIKEYIDIEKQCENQPVRNLIEETSDENFKRMLVFYKAIKDANVKDANVKNIEIPLDKVALKKEEEEEFISFWNDKLKNVPIDKRVVTTIQEVFGLKDISNSVELDNIAMNFANGGRTVSPLLAYNCKKKGHSHQGFLARFIPQIISNNPEEKEIHTHYNNIICHEHNISAGPIQSKKLGNLCIKLECLSDDTIYEARERELSYKNSRGSYDAIKITKSLYILTDEKNREEYVYKQPYKSTAFSKMPLYFNRIFSENHIEDIHPQLAYLIWNDMGLRQKYWKKAFAGNYAPPNRIMPGLEKYKEEFAALYFAMCYYNTFVGAPSMAASVAPASAAPVSSAAPASAAPAASMTAASADTENNAIKAYEERRRKKQQEAAAGLGLKLAETTGGENLKAASEPMLPKVFYALPNREKYPIMLQNIRLLPNDLITNIFDIAGWATPEAGFFSKKRNFAQALQAKFPGKSGTELLEEVILWYINNPDSTPVKGFRPVEGRFFGGRYSRKHNKKHTHKKKTKKRRSRSA